MGSNLLFWIGVGATQTSARRNGLSPRIVDIGLFRLWSVFCLHCCWAAGLLILFLVSSHVFGLAPIQLSDVPRMVVEQAPLRRGFRVQSYNVNRQCCANLPV